MENVATDAKRRAIGSDSNSVPFRPSVTTAPTFANAVTPETLEVVANPPTRFDVMGGSDKVAFDVVGGSDGGAFDVLGGPSKGDFDVLGAIGSTGFDVLGGPDRGAFDLLGYQR